MRVAMMIMLAAVLVGVGSGCEKRIEEARRAPVTVDVRR